MDIDYLEEIKIETRPRSRRERSGQNSLPDRTRGGRKAHISLESVRDKKLLIEALPSYMFIQPTKEPVREPDGKNNGGSNTGDPELPTIIPTKSEIDEYEGTPCGTDGSGRLHYANGKWYCKYGG